MSAEEFVKELRKTHKKDLDEIEKLLEILDKVRGEKKEVYKFFITSNL